MAELTKYVPPESELGHLIWHSSEEDGGPDVGLTLGLGNGQTLWLGELAAATVAAAGVASTSPSGWWLAVFTPTGTEVIAAIADTEAARDLYDRLFAITQMARNTGRLALKEGE